MAWVLGFSSNDFAGQEPGSNAEIAAFCEDQFAVRFPMFMKTPVTGARAHPSTPTWRGSPAAPKWNFHKYLIGRDGRTVKGLHTSFTTPEDGALLRDIRAELASPLSGVLPHLLPTGARTCLHISTLAAAAVRELPRAGRLTASASDRPRPAYPVS